jgi:hypothetical protein
MGGKRKRQHNKEEKKGE